MKERPKTETQVEGAGSPPPEQPANWKKVAKWCKKTRQKKEYLSLNAGYIRTGPEVDKKMKNGKCTRKPDREEKSTGGRVLKGYSQKHSK